jgi:hypothetical protein
VLAKDGPVAQLDRASAFEAEGWGFEPLRAHHKIVNTVAVELMSRRNCSKTVVDKQASRAAGWRRRRGLERRPYDRFQLFLPSLDPGRIVLLSHFGRLVAQQSRYLIDRGALQKQFSREGVRTDTAKRPSTQMEQRSLRSTGELFRDMRS